MEFTWDIILEDIWFWVTILNKTPSWLLSELMMIWLAQMCDWSGLLLYTIWHNFYMIYICLPKPLHYNDIKVTSWQKNNIKLLQVFNSLILGWWIRVKRIWKTLDNKCNTIQYECIYCLYCCYWMLYFDIHRCSHSTWSQCIYWT